MSRKPGQATKSQLRLCFVHIVATRLWNISRFRFRLPLPKVRFAFWLVMGRAWTISSLNKEHVNNRVYVSLLEANPEAMVADKIMPSLPPSIMNVMDGMRGTQDMVISNESSLGETATSPLEYVIAGAQVLTINIK